MASAWAGSISGPARSTKVVGNISPSLTNEPTTSNAKRCSRLWPGKTLIRWRPCSRSTSRPWSHGEPIKNPVTGAERRARIDLPHGFEYEIAEIGSDATKTQGNVVLDLKSSYAQFA